MGKEPSFPLIYNDYLKVYRAGIVILLIGITLFISVFIFEMSRGETGNWFNYLYISIILLAIVPLLYLVLYFDRFHLYDDHILLPNKTGVPPRPQRLYKEDIQEVIIFQKKIVFRKRSGGEYVLPVTFADKLAFKFYLNRNGLPVSDREHQDP